MTLQCVDFMQITIRHVRIAQMGGVCVFTVVMFTGDAGSSDGLLLLRGLGWGWGGGVATAVCCC